MSNSKRYILINMIVLAVLEVLTTIASVSIADFSYTIGEIILLFTFMVFQILFSLGMENFTNGKKGLVNFILYKGIKAFAIIVPLLIYIIVSEKPDLWLVLETGLYYFVFLIVETVIFVKHQRNEKTA